MSTKQTIAVDIDDVLADNAQGFVDFSNQRWGTNLTVDDYDEHWGQLWGVDEAEVNQRSLELHQSGAFGRYTQKHDARPVLTALAEDYRLLIVTSRRSIVSKETLAWIDKYYGGLFAEIRFAGFFDNGVGLHMTKADICKELGADYLIDDQKKHCFAAAEAGIQALLFGGYSWNRTEEPLPAGVTRVADWQGVAAYFKQRKGGDS